MTALAEQFTPRPDFAERHEIDISASPEAVWSAWQAMTITDPPPIARALIAVRSCIARLRHGHAHSDLPKMFIPLAAERPREVVEGLVGRWWEFGKHRNREEITGPAGFLAFAEPGYAKATVSFSFTETGAGRTHVVTETRVVCMDAGARRAMARYWLLIRPFSGVLRMALLRTLRKRATR
ncbi:DUF2867 domain-containing protein [Amycolatopsis regifaucium]|uniref:DUF2867 domain-containing protein n=1 Tax=Amycolatopsis regifaucium TaxID=546365 RepID=A0A154MNX1_9PSEU|nr:DUF2867 domain-containing protein [Amycolatopsis regifaucium]KZB85994.1 hypothetical protein AVL48_27740 [Amycolatopsis regifaucium]OKA04885.1 hypothetical protein ATP06_0227800 [Amycolatopsis regifaucium]SFH74154.1 Protein of unknown function [Amycolatopsis regifaucium]